MLFPRFLRMLKKIVTNLLPIFIVATIACLPLYVIRCSSFDWCVSPVPFTLLEVLIVITSVIWLLNKLISGKKFDFYLISQKIALAYRIIFLIFISAALVSLLISPERAAALGVFKAYFLEPVVFAWVCFDYLQETRNNKILILPLALAATWMGVLAFSEQIFHFSLANQNEFLLRGRVSGVYLTSNALSLFLGPILFVLLGKISDLAKEKDKLKNITLLYVLTIGVFASAVGVLLSGSRGGIFGVFCGLILFLVLKNIVEKNNGRLLTVFQRIIKYLLPILIVLSIIFLFNVGILAEFNNKNKIVPEANSRLCLWQGSSDMVRKSPILGTGLASFQEIYKENQTCSQEIINYQHNIILNFWLETGIFGLISFLGILFLLCYQILRLEKISLTALGIVCALAAVFIHGLVDVPYFKNDLSVLFWILVVLALFEIDYKTFIVRHRSVRQNPRH